MSLGVSIAFPAPAGLNRSTHATHPSFSRVPRTRGAEPKSVYSALRVKPRSPHPRG